mgnify:CR=1 FL=1
MENQDRAKTRLQVRKNVIVKQATTRMSRVETIRDKSQAQVTNSIRDFEARLTLMKTHTQASEMPLRGAGRSADVPPAAGVPSLASLLLLLVLLLLKKLIFYLQLVNHKVGFSSHFDHSVKLFFQVSILINEFFNVSRYLVII